MLLYFMLLNIALVCNVLPCLGKSLAEKNLAERNATCFPPSNSSSNSSMNQKCECFDKYVQLGDGAHEANITCVKECKYLDNTFESDDTCTYIEDLFNVLDITFPMSIAVVFLSLFLNGMYNCCYTAAGFPAPTPAKFLIHLWNDFAFFLINSIIVLVSIIVSSIILNKEVLSFAVLVLVLSVIYLIVVLLYTLTICRMDGKKLYPSWWSWAISKTTKNSEYRDNRFDIA